MLNIDKRRAWRLALIAVVAAPSLGGGMAWAASNAHRSAKSGSIGATTTYLPSPSTPAPARPLAPVSTRVEHLEGTHRGIEHYALHTARCPVLDHHLDETLSLSDGKLWTYDAAYCGTISGSLWTGVGTFTVTSADGATITGSFTNSAVLPTKGVPYELDISGGTKRFAEATGSCVLSNHVQAVRFGVQDQFGTFVCDFTA